MVDHEAAVVWGPGEPFVMEQVQVDPPQKKEVRIKILFTSICHTDLSAWKGEVIVETIYIFNSSTYIRSFCCEHGLHIMHEEPNVLSRLTI